MARRTLTDRRAIVTGASSGIGRAVASELVRNGCRVLAVARREERLADLGAELAAVSPRGEERFAWLTGDITAEATRAAALERMESLWGGLDILVNNVGVGALGPFASADPARLRRIMEVNFFALVEFVRAALPRLRCGVSPIVVNVGSILGHRGLPFSSEYCASKFAVRGFTESLRAECASQGIDVLLVSPGTTESEFGAHVLERTVQVPWANSRAVAAEYVARETVRAIHRGRREIIPNARGRWLVRLNRFCPWLLDWWLARLGRGAK